jgi:hypothetical protein
VRNSNGTALSTTGDDVDLAGVLELAYREAREDLARRSDRCDALRQLRARALALAVKDDEIVTGPRLWGAAVDEADRALLDALLARAVVDLPESLVDLFKHEEESQSWS